MHISPDARFEQSRKPHLATTGRTETATSGNHSISLICDHYFESAVLAASLRAVFPDDQIRTFKTQDEWVENRCEDPRLETVLYNVGDSPISAAPTKEELREFIACANDCRVIVISRSDDVMAVFDAIDCGAASYIPPSAGLDALVEALRMPASDSVVIARQSLKALREALGRPAQKQPGLERYFTERQLAVARALQRGAANKTIAYELGLCESTVKVHIRNIMRKLRATNRTQAAYRLNELAGGNTEIEVLPDE